MLLTVLPIFGFSKSAALINLTLFVIRDTQLHLGIYLISINSYSVVKRVLGDCRAAALLKAMSRDGRLVYSKTADKDSRKLMS